MRYGSRHSLQYYSFCPGVVIKYRVVAKAIKIGEIIEAIRAKRVRITDHADEEASEDKLKYEEIYNSVLQGEIIESYPEDKPYPSCLVLGMNPVGQLFSAG